jgi:hypothetical protein
MRLERSFALVSGILAALTCGESRTACGRSRQPSTRVQPSLHIFSLGANRRADLHRIRPGTTEPPTTHAGNAHFQKGCDLVFVKHLWQHGLVAIHERIMTQSRRCVAVAAHPSNQCCRIALRFSCGVSGVSTKTGLRTPCQMARFQEKHSAQMERQTCSNSP